MTQPKLSTRGLTAPASPIRRLMPYADQARARGVHVHHLNIGQPDLPTPKVMIDAYRNFDHTTLAYSPSQGIRAYREALADFYNGLGFDAGGGAIDPDQIMVTVGGSEALLFAFASICDAGDEVVVPEPYYTNYAGFSHVLGVKVRPVLTKGEDNFAVDPQAVAAACTDKTRALVLPSPGNPTGAVLDRATLEALGKICMERGMFFIVDEVYREFVYNGAGRSPSVLEIPELAQCAVMVDSVSKRYSACGARIGCLVTRNADLYATALKFAQARLSPPTVDQLAAQAALSTPASWLTDAVSTYRERRDVLVNGLNSIPGVRCAMPQGAFYFMADLPVDDTEDFCIFMLSQFDLGGETVMFAPGEGFYATEGLGCSQVRVAYVLEVEKLKRCVEILRAGLEAYKSR
mgnify:CR=1 FL=1